MNYLDGQQVRLGDHVRLGAEANGLVVFSIDTREYDAQYPRADWEYLERGIMVESPEYGLIHYEQPDAELTLVRRHTAFAGNSGRP